MSFMARSTITCETERWTPTVGKTTRLDNQSPLTHRMTSVLQRAAPYLFLSCITGKTRVSFSLIMRDSDSGLVVPAWTASQMRPLEKATFPRCCLAPSFTIPPHTRSEEHTSELQSLTNLVCRLLLEKK